MNSNKILNSLLWHLGGSVPRNRADLQRLLQATRKQTTLIPSGELAMIENILQLQELRVEEVMIPHGKVDWLHADDSYAEVLSQVSSTQHSRYPVIDTDNEKAVGILHVKRLLGLKANRDDLILVDKLLQEARVVPESKRLDAMLREFQHYRLHMMVVADEGGHPSGMVTIEDVLEKIVGAIHDEFDQAEGIKVNITKTTRPNVWTVSGATPIEEFNTNFKLDLHDERFDTVGGWVANHFGRLPKTGETFIEGELLMRVTSANQRQVLQLDVERRATPTANDTHG